MKKIVNKIVDGVLDAAVVTVEFVDGRFGRKVLKPQYRRWWRVATYGTLAVLFVRFVMCPFFAWWDKVVDFFNYVIWG